MVQKKAKRGREEVRVEEKEEVVETTRGSEEEPAPKRARWTNKTRVLVISARGIGFRSGIACQSVPGVVHSWMKEVKGIRHRGRGVYLRWPVFTTVQFSLRNEGSSEYICLCEEREILSPNFQTFQDPGINSTELADWFQKPFIFLPHSHYYIYRRK
jgi:hypothetical protein